MGVGKRYRIGDSMVLVVVVVGGDAIGASDLR